MSTPNTTVEKVLDILLLFDEHHSELSIDEISHLIQTPRSTTYRYIAILQNRGFLEKTTPGVFRLGLRILQLSRALRSKWDIADIARPVLEMIAQDAHETVLLTRLFVRKGICVDRVEAPQTIRTSFEPGQIQPLHAGASWKILLAHVQEEAWNQYLALPLEAFTDETITDPEILKDDLRRIRRMGFCISHAEVDKDVVAVAVPILNHRRQIVAGLSVAGPAFRMDEDAIQHHLMMLKDGVAEIQALLTDSGRMVEDR